MVIAFEISGNKALVLEINGKPLVFEIIRPSIKFEIPEIDDSIPCLIDFQKNIEMYFQNKKPDLIVLCEGGTDSKKRRIRMEYSILIACHHSSIEYKTYPTNSASKYINTGFMKEFNINFEQYFSSFKLPKSYQRLLASAIRYLK